MPKLTLVKGTKMYLSIADGERKSGSALDYNLISSFEKSISEASFLISAPLKNGRPIPLDISKKIYFKYTVDSETYLLEGYPDSTESIGIRTFWRIRKTSEVRTFVLRSSERISAAIKIRYSRLNWLSDDSSTMIEKEDFEPGLSLDISAGGLALYMNDQVPVAEMLLLYIPAIENKFDEFIIRGEVCWTREVYRGSFRFISGFKFVFDSAGDRDKMADYAYYIKELSKPERKKTRANA